MITVIGLGLNEGDLTLRALNTIKSANKIFIKTAKTHTYDFFKTNNVNAISFDELYDEAEDFNDLNEKIINKLVEEKDDVIFCVNGNGCDDSTVIELAKRTEIKIIAGVGFADKANAVYPAVSSMSYGAYDIVSRKVFLPDKRHSLIIREIDNKYLAGDIKLILSNVYGDDKKIIVFDSADQNADKKIISLSDLDKYKLFSYSTTVVVPEENFLNSTRFDFCDLIEIMENLLGENGCPWDRAQTHESIRINLIEEAYELVDAIDSGDLDGMIEESGDVLLQAVFHCMIGKLDEEFDYNDVLTNLCNKLITRHTHIFGEHRASNAEEALNCWNTAKNIEKNYDSLTDKMEKIPKNLPALLYAYKIQKVAVKCGFDWADIQGTYDKLQEEIEEFQKADVQDATMEAGDLLFSAINPMRWRDIDPELALKASCDKFIKRFKYMEDKIMTNGEDIGCESVREKYWAEAKRLYK